MVYRGCLLLLLAAMPVWGGDWNPRLAKEYLDGRQKLWLEWPTANAAGAPCISCHTGLTYLLARPALRQALGENGPTTYETALLDGLRKKLPANNGPEWFPKLTPGLHADEIFGANALLAALLLSLDDARAGRGLSPESERALERMWAIQLREGSGKGAWHWTALDLDPWETTDSMYFGAALAAVATGSAPGDYQSRPKIRENIAALTAYLRDAQQSQPLHNRLTALWASRKLKNSLADRDREDILGSVRKAQSADGGWTVASLGAWKEHSAAPPVGEGSHAYATALVAFLLERAGVERSDPTLAKALGWLRRRQDPETGSWEAMSMNKKYPAGSMQIQFMRDAATAYAAAALAETSVD